MRQPNWHMPHRPTLSRLTMDRTLTWSLTIIFLTLLLLMAPRVAHASPNPADGSQDQPVAIYFFWGDGCPHCAEAKPFLQQLAEQYPTAEVRDYEVWYVEENRVHFLNMAAAYGFEATGVPTFFVGDRYWVGYAPAIAEEIAATVAECTVTGCRDAGLGIIPGIVAPTATPTRVESTAALAPATAAPTGDTQAVGAPDATAAPARLDIPFFGTIDLGTQSLAASTALIAFVDGFNPCSLWVLSMLLALTLHTASRRKTFWIGIIFLTVTALIYALFIAGLFTFFSVIGFLGWIQLVVALVALVFALVNIKDYFWYKAGVSFTIADAQKPGIYRRMRAVLDASKSTNSSIWGLAGATVVLAAGVSLVEFSCTAGFPILWTNLLTSQQATPMAFAFLLLLYMVIYQLDELVIFLVAVVTLKSRKLAEKQGRILKLVGGMLMLTLAVVMLVDPALLSRLSTSLVVFGVAFGVAGAILLVHRVIMPRFGLYVGSEFQAPQPQPRQARPTPPRGQRRKHQYKH